MNECHHHCLLLHHSRQGRICGVRGGGEVHAFGHEANPDLIQKHANMHVEAGDMGPEQIELRLSIAAQCGCDDGNAHATAEVSHEIKEAGRVSHLFLFDQTHGDRC